MGVSVVLSHPIPENKSSQNVLESLYKLLETLGAKQTGRFKLDCETYTSTSPVLKVLQTFHDIDRPNITFALLDSGQCLCASPNFDKILDTYLNAHYVCKKPQRIECCGKKFDLCESDFVIRVGAVSQDILVRGITIEIEYTPCITPQDCWDILSQVACNFVSISLIPAPPRCEIFKPSDMIKQYQQVFNTLRKNH